MAKELLPDALWARTRAAAILVLCQVSDLINALSCPIFSAWQEQHNPSNYQTTNEAL
jgi:hypothetical protein